MTEKPANKRSTVQIDHKTRDLAFKCRTRLPIELQRKFSAWSAWSHQLVLLGFADFANTIAADGWLRTNYTTSLYPNPLTIAIHPLIMEQARLISLRTPPHATALGSLVEVSPTAIVRWALRRGIDIVNASTPDPEGGVSA